jgi:sporulation protein YunB
VIEIKNFFIKLIFILFANLLVFAICLYALNNTIIPTVMAVADSEMRAKALEAVNKSIIDEYSKEFNYDDVIHIEKDNDGNITMFKADTLKMNRIACNVAVNSQERLKDIGVVGIKIPMGYIFKNNLLAYIGPQVTVKMQPIGSIETKYISEFESAGINQTRHKIYVQVKTSLRVIIPFENNEIEIKNEVPIAETVIVGKVPNTAIDLNLSEAGFKLQNPQYKASEDD